MKKRNVFLMSLLLTMTISVQAKFWGWDKEWNYLSIEGNCIVEYSLQHYYIFGIDTGGSREVEVGRTCTK